MCMKFRAFQKKDGCPSVIISEILKRLKGLASEHHSLMNVFTGSKHLKSAQHHSYPLFSSMRAKLSCKKSASVWYEIVRPFLNALTADDQYSDSNMQNFPQQFQTPLSKKQKVFSGFFIAFLKCAWNLEHFQKKDEYPSVINSEIIDAERRGYLNV